MMQRVSERNVCRGCSYLFLVVPCAEVLVFGSGPSIRPPASELVKELQAQGVGLEVSNTVRLPDPATTQSCA